MKILAIAGSKISLSMREVDQETGRDLKPRGPFALNGKRKKRQQKTPTEDRER